MDITIECRWTKEQIEELLQDQIREQGLMLIPHPKRKEGEPDKLFIWPRGGEFKVRARAVIDPDARPVSKPEDMEPAEANPREKKERADNTSLDFSMLPEGANIEALQAIEKAAAEDPLAKARRSRFLNPGESWERDDE